MDQREVILSLHTELQTDGKPIEKSKTFMTLSDMNASKDDIDAYINKVHNKYEKIGSNEAVQDILTIFRINPLVAVRIIEKCSLRADFYNLGYSIKALFSAVRKDGFVNSDLILLNKNKAPYVALLIEAVYESSFIESNIWQPDMFLEYAQEEDKRLHSENKKPKYLNEYNIRHILTHIPENRQIEFINWFWDKHCYAAKTYGKSETFAGNRVKVMMRELVEGSLWQHLENKNKSVLSEEEKIRVEKERYEIQKFIRSVISEGRHTQYVKTVIGRVNFYDKLQALMGDDFIAEYDQSVENQRLIEKDEERISKEREEREKIKQELLERHQQYTNLVQAVKRKYEKENELLQWHDLPDSKNPQINLWTYWQGSNFEDVKLMILGYDWGCINEKGHEMEECKRKLKALMKSPSDISTKYYSRKYKRTDYSLEVLFLRCFNRNIRKIHYNDLFFSNLCLGYRKSPQTALDDSFVVSDIKDFMWDELRIVRAQSIFCLGEKVFQLFVDGVDPDGVDLTIERDENTKLIYRDIQISNKPVRIYSMPHCGDAGIKKIPMDKQVEYWEMAKDDMKQMGITV